MSEKYFYDIHCHAMNLSHPSLLAFMRRLNVTKYLFLNSIPVVSSLLSGFIKGKLNPAINLLSVMENEMGNFFLLMEEDLKPFLKNEQFQIGGTTYDKIILTPLIMDFGSKDISQYPDIYYNELAEKPIVEQVVDLFNGITEFKTESLQKKMEIYPFLGVNTKNYLMERSLHSSLPILLEKYFSDYTCDNLPHRRQNLFENMGTFEGDIDELKGYVFAGIKVYPPLGFDPWPSDNNEELKKVKYLYDFCSSKCIPITTHCSEGGFKVVDQSEAFTSPERWKPVLTNFPKLKLNLAHLGKQGKGLWLFPKTAWQEMILELIAQYDHVYTDFSCCGFNDNYYQSLKELINAQPADRRNKLKERMLFGSDFMINLLWIDSYRNYLDIFSQSQFFDDDEKDLYCSQNPERFLFG